MKLMKDTASLANMMLDRPEYIEPKVGMDVTQLLWTDRNAYRITAVDPDKKGFVMTRYNAKWCGQGYGDEKYQYDDEFGRPMLHTNYDVKVRYRNNGWKEVNNFNGKKSFTKISLSFNRRDEYRDPSF